MRPVRALWFLIPSKLEGSEVQLTEKQVVLSMHVTLPQGVKSVCALLQKKQDTTISTQRSVTLKVTLKVYL